MIRSNVLAILVASAAALVGAQTTYPKPDACSGNCVAIDPSLIRRDSDGMYFRFNTFNEITILKSSSLEGPWVSQGAAIVGGSSINLDGNKSLWAPDVKKVGDQYIMYYSVSTGGSQNSAIGYATSPTMEYGTWTDHGSTGIQSVTGGDYNAIDPSLFLDPVSGKYYMSFGSYWHGIYVVQMNDAATQVASGATYTNIARKLTTPYAFEGSTIRYRDGYYYLYYSVGDSGSFTAGSLPASGSEYHVVVCRSTSITGPYVGSAGNACLQGYGGTILASHDDVYAPGGQGLYDDPNKGTIIYYHFANTSISYEKTQFQFGWNQIGWSSAGWPFLSS